MSKSPATIKSILQEYGNNKINLHILEQRLDLIQINNEIRPAGGTAQEKKIKSEIARAKKAAPELLKVTENMIAKIKDPQRRQLIEMRYIDRQSWDLITFAIFGQEPDFYENPDNYKRRIYRSHTSAINELVKITE